MMDFIFIQFRPNQMLGISKRSWRSPKIKSPLVKQKNESKQAQCKKKKEQIPITSLKSKSKAGKCSEEMEEKALLGRQQKR
jgi:hypothetical protein